MPDNVQRQQAGWRARGTAPDVLSEVGLALVLASLNPDAVLETLVRTSVDLFGDLCGVRMVTADGQALESRIWHHRDPDIDAVASQILYPVRQPISTGHTGRVVRDCEPLFLLQAPADLKASALTTYMDRYGIAGAMLIPLQSRGTVLGVVHLSRDRASAPYDEEDRDLFLAIVERAGLLYDNARLYREVRRSGLVLEQVDVAVASIDTDGAITSWNPAAERLFGYPRDEVIGRRAAEILSAPSASAHVDAARERTLEDGREGEWRMRRADGSEFSAWARATPMHEDDGTPAGIVGVFTDLTAERHAQQLIERRALQHEAVAALGERALEGGDPRALMGRATDAAARVLQAATALLEHSEDGQSLEVAHAHGFDPDPTGSAVSAESSGSLAGHALSVGRGMLVRSVAEDPRFVAEPFIAAAEPGGALAAVVQGREQQHGVLVAVGSREQAFGEADLRFLQSLTNVLADAIDRWTGDQAQLHRALHDPLTGLPNRTLVLDRIEQALGRMDREAGSLAILFLDIDHFKVINDGLGHGAGDELLAQLAPRLRGAVRPADTVGRFGGDEFVVVCEGVADEAMALLIAERVTESCRPPFRIGGQDHHISLSVGVVVCPRGHRHAEDLLRDADAAMYRAKERGRARVELFDLGMRARAVERMQVERELRGALERDELRVVFQPIVDVATGEITAVEALARWAHPARGTLQPSQFLRVAEESGLVVPLGRRVLELACQTAATWPATAAGQAPSVHVNLAAQQLTAAGEGLCGIVGETLRTTGLAPQRLVLEITETTLLERGVPARDELERLVELGVHIHLDDFGTGYSSLGYLDRFPISGLKIDRSFIEGLDDHAEKRPIVTAILGMADALGLQAVAEGVEREGQLTVLRTLGCTRAQGYLFTRALDPRRLTALMQAGPLRPARPRP